MSETSFAVRKWKPRRVCNVRWFHESRNKQDFRVKYFPHFHPRPATFSVCSQRLILSSAWLTMIKSFRLKLESETMCGFWLLLGIMKSSAEISAVKWWLQLWCMRRARIVGILSEERIELDSASHRRQNKWFFTQEISQRTGKLTRKCDRFERALNENKATKNQRLRNEIN